MNGYARKSKKDMPSTESSQLHDEYSITRDVPVGLWAHAWSRTIDSSDASYHICIVRVCGKRHEMRATRLEITQME